MPRPTLAAYRAVEPSPVRRCGGRLAPGGESRGERAPDSPGVPRISVVSVVRDARDALERTLESVLAQGYPGLEYIVVDGGSTDGTVELLKGRGDEIDLWISEPDGGIYDAMNKGLALASGALVSFLNAGDTYVEGVLAAAAEAFLEHGAEAIYYGDALLHYVDLGLTLHSRAEPRALCYKAGVCHQAVFVPLAVHEAVGLYDLAYRLAADHAFLAGEYLSGRPFVGLGRPIAVYRNDGLSSRRGFVRYRRELVAFQRSRRDGRPLRAALVAALEIGLFKARALIGPLVGRRLSGALARWYFRRRSNVASELEAPPGLR